MSSRYVKPYSVEQQAKNELNLQCAIALGLKVYTIMYPVSDGTPDGTHIVDTVDNYPRYFIATGITDYSRKIWNPAESFDDAHKVREVALSKKQGALKYTKALADLLPTQNPNDFQKASDYYLFCGNMATAEQITSAALTVLQDTE